MNTPSISRPRNDNASRPPLFNFSIFQFSHFSIFSPTRSLHFSNSLHGNTTTANHRTSGRKPATNGLVYQEKKRTDQKASLVDVMDHGPNRCLPRASVLRATRRPEAGRSSRGAQPARPRRRHPSFRAGGRERGPQSIDVIDALLRPGRLRTAAEEGRR